MSVEYENAIQNSPCLNLTFNIQQCCSKAISVNIRNTHLNSALLYTRKKRIIGSNTLVAYIWYVTLLKMVIFLRIIWCLSSGFENRFLVLIKEPTSALEWICNLIHLTFPKTYRLERKSWNSWVKDPKQGQMPIDAVKNKLF